MKTFRSFLVLTFCWLIGCTLEAQTAIGQWSDHLSYRSLSQVCLAGSRVYGASQGGVCYFDTTDYSVVRMNRVTGLSDVGVASIAYDAVTKSLIVAYSNANIDIVQNDRVYNLADIKRSSMVSNKVINAIVCHNRCAYLACGFGIVVVSLDRHEIKETYYLDVENGTNVNDIAFTDSLIVAATNDGLLMADKNNRLLNIYSNWHRDTTSLMQGQVVKALSVNDGRLLARTYFDNAAEQTVYRQDEDGNFVPWLSGDFRSVEAYENFITASQHDSVTVYDKSYRFCYSIKNVDWMSMDANDAVVSSDGSVWIAHNWAGLVRTRFDSERVDSYSPNGPYSDEAYRLKAYGDKMFLCRGGKLPTYSSAYIPAQLSIWQNGRWRLLNEVQGLDTLYDFLDVAVNPKDTAEWLVASWYDGLVGMRNEYVEQVYDATSTNGHLQSYYEGNFRAVLTGAVEFDKKGNAWMLNSLQDRGLVVRYRSGEWQSFDVSSMTGGTQIDKLVVDSVRGYVWFAGSANRIYVHDGERMAYVDPNNGSRMSTTSVTCLVQDHEGDIWVGTNKGVKKIYDGYRAFNDGGRGERSPVTCANILFMQDEKVEYLMAYESVTCMAVDGANRKWVGTATGGLYLLSASGMEELLHFNTSNSPLLSNKIISVAVHPQSGDVFVATDMGVQSYRGTATYNNGFTDEHIYAYPNPVRPDYDGPIAVKGFSRNALVHITDAAGHTVGAMRANGGQAVWNGRDQSGRKVRSGVYYVFASSEDGQQRAVAKVLVIR